MSAQEQKRALKIVACETTEVGVPLKFFEREYVLTPEGSVLVNEDTAEKLGLRLVPFYFESEREWLKVKAHKPSLFRFLQTKIEALEEETKIKTHGVSCIFELASEEDEAGNKVGLKDGQDSNYPPELKLIVIVDLFTSLDTIGIIYSSAASHMSGLNGALENAFMDLRKNYYDKQEIDISNAILTAKERRNERLFQKMFSSQWARVQVDDVSVSLENPSGKKPKKQSKQEKPKKVELKPKSKHNAVQVTSSPQQK